MLNLSSKKLAVIELIVLIIGGVLLWNTWVFGWLNHGSAGYTSMSISELNVAGQPYATFFTVTEWLSGLFMLLSCGGLIAVIHPKRFMLVALVLIALIGALTIFDAWRPVDCSRYRNPVCVVDTNEGYVNRSTIEHVIESRISVVATIALALDLVALAYTEKTSELEQAIVSILAVGIITTSAAGGDLLFSSISQRVWNVLVSFDFLFVASRTRFWIRKS
jgi:hypothetical protein